MKDCTRDSRRRRLASASEEAVEDGRPAGITEPARKSPATLPSRDPEGVLPAVEPDVAGCFPPAVVEEVVG